MAITNSTPFQAASNSWVTIALPERVSEDILLAIATKNPEYQFETTADGRLVVKPLTGFFASGGEAELIRQVANWNAEHRFGHVTSSSGGITRADGAIKGPDTTFTSRARIAALPAERKRRAIEQIAPDAVFELLSPSDDLASCEAKCETYVATGSDVAVLLNPRSRSVTLYRTAQDPVRATDISRVKIEPEMPGFILDAAAVFEAGEEPPE